MIKKKLILLILILFFIEFVSYIFSSFGLFLVNEVPDIYKKNKDILNNYEWRNEKFSWGAWHLPNKTAKHKYRCWDVVYRSNSLGARGKEIIKNQDNDFILLGDSFAEGWGVSEDELFKSQLEIKFNNNVLNLGVSGDFGPVNYYLIYKNFKDNFKHSTVIILFFPFNDFTDNDIEYFKKKNNYFFHSNIPRYKPYYKKVSDNYYEIIYPEKAIKRNKWNGEDVAINNIFNKLEFILYKYFWVGNVYKTIKFVLNVDLYQAIFKPKSGYYDFSLEQQKASIYFIEEIIKIAKDKKIYFISIPRQSDLLRLKTDDQILGEKYWYKKLNELNKNKIITFIDLAQYMSEDYERYYHKCDGHFGKYGNKKLFEFFEKKYN